MHHPNARFFIGFADHTDVPTLPDQFSLIPASLLNLPQLTEMGERYFDFEFVYSLRPWFARYLIGQHPEFQRWVFLAPTVRVYRHLEPFLNHPEELLLTPNITRRLPASPYLDDKRILNIGMFHSNAWIAKPSEDVRKMLDWWCSRMIDRAHFDLCNGMCLDQLWLNYAPVHVPEWKLINDPTWHTGLHNTLLRSFNVVQGKPVSGPGEVYTVDFAGLQTFHPVWSEHTRLVNRDPEWKKLLEEYRGHLDRLSAFRLPGRSEYGRPNPASTKQKFKKSVKSELERITNLIDKLEI
jgi:hypothetical protein